MPDNFNIDDILAEYAEGKNKKEPPKAVEPKPGNISTTSILNSIDQKKAADKPSESPKTQPASRPRPASGTTPTGERPRRPRPADGTVPAGERPRRPRPASGTTPAGETPRRPRPASGTTPTGERPRRPRPASGTTPTGERPRRPRPEGAAAPRRPRPESASGQRPKNAGKKGAVLAPEKQKKKNAIVINDGMTFKNKIGQYRFLFEELTKRDFKKKYKRTFLGVFWSVLSPFMNFLIYLFVFTYLFQRNMEHFAIYIMTGSLMYSFFTTSTNAGMFSMFSNSGVMSKIRVPKTIFLLSSNVACIFNFLLTLVVYFIFVALDGLPFGPHMLLIIYPLVCMTIFNIGIGYILSSMFVFFRDTQYLYGIFTQLLMFVSAIFYTVDRFPSDLQIIFAVNPIYRYITYVRQIVIDGTIPDLSSHLVCFGAAAIALALGYLIHKKTEQKFVYYF